MAIAFALKAKDIIPEKDKREDIQMRWARCGSDPTGHIGFHFPVHPIVRLREQSMVRDSDSVER